MDAESQDKKSKARLGIYFHIFFCNCNLIQQRIFREILLKCKHLFRICGGLKLINQKTTFLAITFCKDIDYLIKFFFQFLYFSSNYQAPHHSPPTKKNNESLKVTTLQTELTSSLTWTQLHDHILKWGRVYDLSWN